MNPLFLSATVSTGIAGVLGHYSSVFFLGIVGFIILALGIFRINKKITAGRIAIDPIATVTTVRLNLFIISPTLLGCFTTTPPVISTKA
jgi:hypothetical protein